MVKKHTFTIEEALIDNNEIYKFKLDDGPVRNVIMGSFRRKLTKIPRHLIGNVLEAIPDRFYNEGIEYSSYASVLNNDIISSIFRLCQERAKLRYKIRCLRPDAEYGHRVRTARP